MTHRIFIISLVLLGLAQFTFGQKAASPAKQKLVSQLVESAQQVVPFEQYESGFQKAREVITADFKKGVNEQLSLKIDSMEVLSAAEKEKLKAKTPEFAEQYAKFVDNLISRDFKMKSWLSESAAKHFNQKFSVTELRKLNTFLRSPDGQKILLVMRSWFTEESKGENPKNSAEAEKFEKIAEKFSETKIGTKFFEVVIDNILPDLKKKMDGWSVRVVGNFDSLINEKEFNNLVNEFFKRTLES